MAGPCPARYLRSRRLDFTCGRADTGRVSPVAEFLFAAALPTLAGFALIYAWRGAGWLGQARARRRAKALPPEPLERLQADLRRLRAELENTETRSGLTAKHHRVQALRRPRSTGWRPRCGCAAWTCARRPRADRGPRARGVRRGRRRAGRGPARGARGPADPGLRRPAVRLPGLADERAGRAAGVRARQP